MRRGRGETGVSRRGNNDANPYQMANISLFLQGACEVQNDLCLYPFSHFSLSFQLGLQPSELFQTVDLYEAKDMGAVSDGGMMDYMVHGSTHLMHQGYQYYFDSGKAQ